MVVLGCIGCNTATRLVTSSESSNITGGILSTSEIVAKVKPSIAHIVGGLIEGTGIIIDSRGYILTNNHVVEEVNSVTVRIQGRNAISAEVEHRNPDLDIAILKCSGYGYPYVTLGSAHSINLGDDVVAIGYPLGSLLGDDPSMSKGIVSAFRNIDHVAYIQTDAPANPGSSGGPLINQYAEVVGIVTWGMSETEGMNFAIDINSIRDYIDDILEQLSGVGLSTKTITQTAVQAQTITRTIIGTTTKTVITTDSGTTAYICPFDNQQFDTLDALKAHLEAVHGIGTTSNPPIITSHGIGPGYDGLCMICHMLGGTDPIPDDGYHPTYDASANQCYNCHLDGSSGIVVPSAVTVTITTTITEPVTVITTITETATPPVTTGDSDIVFTFSGVGERNTPPFSIDTSPWILEYSVNWSGVFTVSLGGDSTSNIILDSLKAGIVYETYIYDKKGSLYFRITSAPSDGEWTLTVIKP